MPTLGTFVGSPAALPVSPPPALAPVSFRQRPLQVVSVDPVERLRRASAIALDEYRQAGGRGTPSADDRLIRAGVAALLEARVDPGHYARYVCMQRRAGSRRVMPAHVFGRKAVAGWLPEFRSRAASWAGGATYECTPARLREHARRGRLELLP